VKDNGHLTEDRIISAVADKALLSVAEKEHLSNCSVCSSAIGSFENDLKQLGRIAELAVPAPERRFTAYVKKPERNLFPVFGLRSSLAAAITILFFTITLHSDSVKYLFTTETGSYVSEIYSEDLFDTEMDSLAENDLPLEYMDIYGEADPDYDDNFIDFILPSSGNNTVSETRNGGIVS
jgi:hypothetical protein